MWESRREGEWEGRWMETRYKVDKVEEKNVSEEKEEELKKGGGVRIGVVGKKNEEEVKEVGLEGCGEGRMGENVK